MHWSKFDNLVYLGSSSGFGFIIVGKTSYKVNILCLLEVQGEEALGISFFCLDSSLSLKKKQKTNKTYFVIW